MAYDGFTVGCIKNEIEKKALGGRIYKIQQPEKDELVLMFRKDGETSRLSISVDASLPIVHFTEKAKTSPLTAPSFLMLLRKHIGSGKVIEVSQPGNERMIDIIFEHLDEMGDVQTKKLRVEIMGRHSNIIFMNSEGIILDSIKHISHEVSSVREVLPGREYIVPPTGGKENPYVATEESFTEAVMKKPLGVAKAICNSYEGFSYVMAAELCYRAGIDADVSTDYLRYDEPISGNNEIQEGLQFEKSDTADRLQRLFTEFEKLIDAARAGEYSPAIYFEGDSPKEFSVYPMTMYSSLRAENYDTGSELIEAYYSKKSSAERIRQKSADLRQIINTHVERAAKKYDLQNLQMKDTEDMEKFRIYGELINTYGYSVPEGSKELKCTNYYDNTEVTIHLDTDKTVSENAQKYFEKYNKKKRTKEALTTLLETTRAELDYLLSVKHSLDIAEAEEDVNAIKEELVKSGIIAGKGGKKGEKTSKKSKPMHFVTEDGFDIYVGRNNIQNDYLTFKVANGNDMWFHAKKMPGSHVIVKRKGEEELPDHIYEIAAAAAAFFSSGKENPKVEIDYTERKNLKKPPAANLGYVIYHTNYSMSVVPGISQLTLQDE